MALILSNARRSTSAVVAMVALLAMMSIVSAGAAYAEPCIVDKLGDQTGDCNFGDPKPSATPELDSLFLFGSGIAGIAGYAALRIRARR